jgi:putative membrane protein
VRVSREVARWVAVAPEIGCFIRLGQAPRQPGAADFAPLGQRLLQLLVDTGAQDRLAFHMASLLITWALTTVAFLLTAAVLPGFELKGGWNSAALVAALFGIINWAIGWLLFVTLGIASLGIGFLLAFLTRWVVNAILLKITDALTDRLTIRSFGTAMIAALLISLFGTLGQWLLGMIMT